MTSEFLNNPEYDFLRTNPNLSHIVLLGLGGSHAYGTNNESSDIDIRGIALNSKEEILLGKDFDQVVDTDTDTTIYSLRKMFELLSNCNPNTIEILGLEPDQYFIKTPIGQTIIDNQEIFLSKRCINSFGGYANQQMYRLQQKSLCALSKEDYNAHTARVLEKMILKFEKVFGLTPDKIHPYVGESGDLMLDLNFNGFPAENVSAMLSELNQTIRDYSAPSKRNQKAETHGKIAKHSMHLLRLYMMCIDLLEKHEIKTKRTDEHDLLMSIRNGEYLDETGKPTQEFFDIVHEYELHYQEAAKTTTLPDEPDLEKINKLRIVINENVVNESVTNGYITLNKQPYTDHLCNRYKSVADMCERWNIHPKTFEDRIRAGWSLEKALKTPAKKTSSIKDHLGNKFKSVSEMCKHWNINRSTFEFRLNSGWTLEKTLTTPAVKNNSTKCRDHLNNEFESLSEMCKYWDIHSNTFTCRIASGWSLKKALTEPMDKNRVMTCFDHLGNKYKSMTEMAKAWNISSQALTYRLKHGYSLEHALTIK